MVNHVKDDKQGIRTLDTHELMWVTGGTGRSSDRDEQSYTAHTLTAYEGDGEQHSYSPPPASYSPGGTELG
jgi:hypothetical protein